MRKILFLLALFVVTLVPRLLFDPTSPGWVGISVGRDALQTLRYMGFAVEGMLVAVVLMALWRGFRR